MRNDESSYRAARQYQADHPGVSYTRAKRMVTAATSSTRAPLVASFPGEDGQPVAVNLEWASGPHALLIGADAPALLPALADTLSAEQDERDLEIIYSTAQFPGYRIRAEHTHIPHRQLVDHVDSLACTRQSMLREFDVPDIEKARAHGHRIPTVVVFIDRPDLELTEAILGWSRIGRSLGIDFVVAGAAAPVPEGAGDVAEGDRYCGNLDRAVPEMDYLRKSGMFRVIVSVVSVGRAALVIDDTRPGADRVIREFRYGSAVARP
ncbi:hypothetical protein [Mycolicibacterium llatzerense]|uniref:Uncharacterized protein n=1 Tax=Mycolicibacterium llatzerense TaxID=280871 RepID=A0A0D1L7C6_9MYCO|nr:hypothetical protein [Mycolicibacterium llatzerense]KIU14232.1 hypothetical protein TL10_25550 [Mycolicibacterium llatzerense]MCT7372557.1 hypothetical protein [Mycolicibacterium llatzerense]